MPEFSRYRRIITAEALPALREASAQDPPPHSVLLGAAPAVLLVEDDPLLHAKLAAGLRTLGDPNLGLLADPAGHRRPVYHPFVLHLHLAAFGRLYESLSVSAWSLCEEATPQAIEACRACEDYTDAPPPSAITDVTLWQALCVLEQAKLLSRDIDAEWVEGVVHQIAARNGEAGSLHPRHADESLDAWTFRELCGLHALANLALLANHAGWAKRVGEVAAYHQERTQPDHVTTQPWGLFAFAWSPGTQSFAEQQLHDATGQGPCRIIAAMLLADAAQAMDRFTAAATT